MDGPRAPSIRSRGTKGRLLAEKAYPGVLRLVPRGLDRAVESLALQRGNLRGCAMTHSTLGVHMALKSVTNVGRAMAEFRFAQGSAKYSRPTPGRQRSVRVASVMVAALTALLLATGFAPGRAVADLGAS